MPHALVCPNPFKGTLSAAQSAEALARGLRRAGWSAETLALADGGPGTLEALRRAGAGSPRRIWVRDPLGRKRRAQWLQGGNGDAFIESAQAIGLEWCPLERRQATAATSRGLGELLLAARDAGARRIWVGLGGSATSDGGVGCAQALGWSFTDAFGAELPSGGGALERLARIRRPRTNPMKGVRVRVLCDVGNPLWGLNGAARVYAPQKGASPQEVALLEQGLKRLARHASWAEAQAPGAGAAGGLGFGLEAFVGARREPGARALLDWVGFEGRARRADWIVTGEGCLDRQTLAGKLPAVVAERARILGRPCAVFAGALELPPATLRKAGWTAWRSAPALRPKAAALALEKAAEAWGRECSGPALVGIPKMS